MERRVRLERRGVLIETKLLENTEMDSETVKQMLDIVAKYRSGTWVYPGVIKRKLNLSINIAYTALEVLCESGFLDSYYELICSNCHKTTGTAVKTFTELPSSFQCEICAEVLPTMDDTTLICKVL